MKKVLGLFFIITLLTACNSSQSSCGYNIRSLLSGMTKYEVERIVGPAERILDITWTTYGYREILQYRNCYNELFALQYIEGRLVSADYLYHDAWYPAFQTPPQHGYPVFPPNYRPGRPNRPPADVPPIHRPPSQQRPPSNGSGTLPPANTRPPSNPGSGNVNRPSSPGSTDRPAGTGASDRNPNRNQQGTDRNTESTTTRNPNRTENTEGSSSTRRQSSQDNNGSGSSRRQ